MKYNNTAFAIFKNRPNRFIAHVDLDGREETVHVKNTGRCKELLLPGSRVVLQKSDNQSRKTRYDLIAVKKKGLGWVNIDSQVPNTAVKEWLEGSPAPFPDITLIKPEYTFGNSRVDFYIECPGRKILLEVKGCTLEKEGMGYFPDAPTARGTKHLKELTAAVSSGYECYIAFVIAMPGIDRVLPNKDTDPQFAAALDEAKKAGVNVLYLRCLVEPDELRIAD